ncbi:MAG TPA: hypothetical protein VFS29_05810 [Motilibacteraceae bacterium]|nr:hypothetical protein [Motilibacteraceae bacterium]
MGLFGRRRSAGAAGRPGVRRGASSEDREHLVRFAGEHSGVEAFVEPPTAVTSTTVLLVAGTGEWTRRRCPSAAHAHALAHELGIPSYDAAVVGYPQRMRDWNARQKAQQRREGGPDSGAGGAA